MKDDWTCGCSMLGGHTCGKQKSDNFWGVPGDAPKIGDRVVCIKQFPDSKGSFDGDIGIVIGIDHTSKQKYKVTFQNGSYSHHVRWVYEVKKV